MEPVLQVLRAIKKDESMPSTYIDSRPLAVGEKTAAAMLDMSTKDFCELVSCGALPDPKNIGRHKRWLVADLEGILSGKAARPDEAFTI